MRIRVLFLNDVPPRYQAGEILEVAGGYARNFLVPRGLAVLATKDQLNRVTTVKRAGEVRRKTVAEQQGSLADRLQGASITILARAGEGGRLYGSITNMLLAQELHKVLGVEVDRRLIDLPEPIRALGTFQVPIRLASNLTPTVTVTVESATPGQAAAPASTPSEQPVASQESAEASDEEDAKE